MSQQRHGRRGSVFAVRVTDEEREQLAALQARGDGPRALGPWMVWAALRSGAAIPAQRADGGSTGPGRPALEPVVPARVGTTLPRPRSTSAEVLPDAGGGSTPAIADRIILDLCGGCGAWSKPYRDAGYDVRLVTLPEHDVRTFVPPPKVHGVLAAPPCEEFSTARRDDLRSRPRDLVVGMECVNACMRIILQSRPVWWALENPTGHLSKFLGTPRDVWQPADFGDPWTKQTAIWGDFRLPERGPFVRPLGNGPFCGVCDPEGRRRSWCNNAAHRAVTPGGFARAFFEANP